MAQPTIPTLKAAARAETGSRASRRVRRLGLLPAVLYGHKEQNVALTVDHDEVEMLLRQGTHLVELSFDGNLERALIKDIQHDFGGYGLLHIDFERVALDETITVTVALDFHGTPAGSTHGGVVEYHVTEIDVRCLPMDIPDAIRVDISHLDIAETMHARDLLPPEGVKILKDPDEIIVGVLAPRAEVVEEEEAEVAEPEVIGENKEEEASAEE